MTFWPRRSKIVRAIRSIVAGPSLAEADYDPSSGLEKITASVVAINAIDDERNPPELGVMEAAMKRLQNGRYVLLPLGPDSRGHGTTGQAKLWKQYLAELLQTAPRK
jgi:homoserine O-acetyltransferase